MRVIIVGAYPSSLIKFRGELIREMVSLGHEVHAVAASSTDGIESELTSLGATFSSYPVKRNGGNPFTDLISLIALYRIFRSFKPDVVFTYTVKPVIWGGIAAYFAKVPARHAMITGLGHQFNTETAHQRFLSRIIGLLYKVALKHYNSVIFQNNDDYALLNKMKAVTASQAQIVDGSGVSIDEYPSSALPEKPVVFLTIARFITSKGIREYAAAARLVKAQHPDVIFRLVGFEDKGKTAIPAEEIKQLHDDGILDVVGQVSDALQQLLECHVYVLASYYGEGLPRTILEAMAVGRPILTTDNVGCREPVVEGLNGKLVEPRNAEALAAGMEWFLANQKQWEDMALASRELIESKYDVKIVNKEMLRVLGL